MLNNLNLYNLVSEPISLITPKRSILINKAAFKKTLAGDLLPDEPFQIKVMGIVQPFTLAQLHKLGDSSLDSALCFKVYLSSKDAMLITSNELNFHGLTICFKDPIDSEYYYMHDIFGVQNYTMNGWIRLHVVRTNLKVMYDVDKG